MSSEFLELVSRGPVVFDGAMGTLLYQRGVFINRNFDELNLSRPDLVSKAHEDYVAAGAMVLETNTFGANAVKLSRHGIEDKVAAINAAGVRLCREAARGKALVAGSIGPTGVVPDIFDPALLDRLREAFREQAVALVAAGVDLLVLETFRYPLEMQVALPAVKSVAGCPVVATMTFDEEARTADGMEPERVAALLASWGADVLGTNCGEGPSRVFDCAVRMLGPGLPVLAQPNAGRPRRVEGRVIYMATPEYFGEYAKRFLTAGVKLVGGCCGSTPDHIRQVAAEARMQSGGRIQVLVPTAAPGEDVGTAIVPPPVEERTSFGHALRTGFVVSVEVDPPNGVDPGRAIAGARLLAAAGIRFVNIADGPRATARMSPIALAGLLAREAGVEPIVHVTCRDRNLLGIQADLLGAHAVGLRNLLIITGDPSKLGDYPDATTVYDLDSVGLLRLVNLLNRATEPSGRRMKAGTGFVKGTGAEPGAADLSREVDRLFLKKEAGADFVMTQPVYDAEVMDRFLDRIRGLDLPILMGVLPLASFRNAEFLHHEVPGMTIPEPIRDRMRAAGSGAAGREEGIRIAREALAAFRDRVQGVYVMPPFERYDTAVEVVAGLVSAAGVGP
jgi:homocysteine S-methyltransferase